MTLNQPKKKKKKVSLHVQNACDEVSNINNRISCLVFNILYIKIPLHKFLNSLKYPYLLVQ